MDNDAVINNNCATNNYTNNNHANNNSTNHFFRLNHLPAPELTDALKLDSIVLEEEIKNHTGINLSEINSQKIESEDEKYYRSFVPYFFFGEEMTKTDILRILEITNKYPNIKNPCSMLVSSVDELLEHMSIGYQVAHFHYILGKKYQLNEGQFPKDCCGTSSRNVMLSLIELGYPNATYAYKTGCDHGYTLLPFVLEKEKFGGTIVIDPTYDQLWNHNSNLRNAVFVKFGLGWDYVTDWDDGGNLFPNRLCSIDIIRKTPYHLEKVRRYHEGGTIFLQRAFSNPIRLKELAK